MKVAVPTKGNEVDNHNGFCKKYTLFTINDKLEIESSETLEIPQSTSIKNSFITTLIEKEINTLLVGNMNDGAFFILEMNGIKVLRGNSGEIIKVVENYLQSNLNTVNTGQCNP